MKKLFIILIILLCSVSSFAGKGKLHRRWKRHAQEQKYRFADDIRRVKHQGRLRIIRAKNNQKVRNRCGSYYYSIYAQRACPR